MKKRFLNLILALVLVVCVLPMAVFADMDPNWCIVNGGHYWENADGICVECGTVCEHSFENGTCTVCNMQCAHGSKIWKITEKATCETDGLTGGYVCGDCGHVISGRETIPALTHDYDYAILKEATCVAVGEKKITCKRTGCDYEDIEEIPVDLDAHKEKLNPGVAATCTESGWTDGKLCENCDAVLKYRIKIDALGHDFTGEETIIWNVSCSNYGKKAVQCTRCDEEDEIIISKLAHTPVEVAEVPATCVTAGKTAGTMCSVCKETLSGLTEIPANPNKHDFVFEARVKDPTCTDRGIDRYRCKNCTTSTLEYPAALGHTEVDIEATAATCAKKATKDGKKCSVCDIVLVEPVEYGNKLPHDMELIRIDTAATCVDTGFGRYDCKNCGYAYDGTIDALGHDKVVDVFREATCTQTGCTKTTCARENCGLYLLEEVEMLPHTEEVVPAVPATCTATGLTEGKKCSVCNEVFVAQAVTSMTAHEFSVDVEGVDATCTADGYTAHKKCANCDATQGKEEIDTDGHNFVNYVCTKCGIRDGSCNHENAEIQIIPATCTVNGQKKFNCPTCGDSYDEVLEATGHAEQSHSTAGTCLTQGKTWTSCTVCGQIVEPETATGYGNHNYVNDQCTYCGETDPDSICEHTNGYTTNTVAATCTQSGSITTRCGDCGEVVDVSTIPAKGHSYNNGVCTSCGRRDSNKITSDFQDIFLVG